MITEKSDTRDEVLKEVVKNTPQIFSINDLIGLSKDDEDHMIYERRCYESERRMR